MRMGQGLVAIVALLANPRIQQEQVTPTLAKIVRRANPPLLVPQNVNPAQKANIVRWGPFPVLSALPASTDPLRDAAHVSRANLDLTSQVKENHIAPVAPQANPLPGAPLLARRVTRASIPVQGLQLA